jgi:hypothetical protein
VGLFAFCFRYGQRLARCTLPLGGGLRALRKRRSSYTLRLGLLARLVLNVPQSLLDSSQVLFARSGGFPQPLSLGKCVPRFACFLKCIP